MKKFILILAGLIIALLTVGFYFSSCKKKSDDNTVSSQRVVELAGYSNDTLLYNSVYKYSGNLISEIIVSAAMIEVAKTTCQYAGDKITSITDSEISNGNWVKTYLTEVISYSGNNPTEIIEHNYAPNGNETNKYKYTFSYDGSIIKEASDYSYASGNWNESSRTIYTYDNNGRIIEVSHVYLSGHNWEYKTSFIYDGNTMKASIDSTLSNGTWQPWDKTTFEYENNRLKKSNYLYWANNSWVNYSYEMYEYNDRSNVTRHQWVDVSGQNSESSDFKIKYEEGSGNFRQFELIRDMLVMIPGYPYPYPVKSTPPWPGKNQLGFSKFERQSTFRH